MKYTHTAVVNIPENWKNIDKSPGIVREMADLDKTVICIYKGKKHWYGKGLKDGAIDWGWREEWLLNIKPIIQEENKIDPHASVHDKLDKIIELLTKANI